MSEGIVLLGEQEDWEDVISESGHNFLVSDEMVLEFDKTLFVEAGAEIPFDLVPAAWHFLNKWDAAIPLWRYGMTAEDVGTPEERKYTKEIIRDMRVLLPATELLFVRRNEAGEQLLEVYKEEMEGGRNKRLAFLRANYKVKPRLCMLPRTWLAKIFEREKMDARGRNRPTSSRLVRVEIEAGRFVKCKPGDEEKVIEMYEAGR